MNEKSVGGRILARLEGFATALERGDDIKESFTCRTIVLDLKPLPYTPDMVQEVRKSLGVSQAILGVLLDDRFVSSPPLLLSPTRYYPGMQVAH